MVIVGLDVGGTTTKAVALNKRNILAKTVTPTYDHVSSASGALGKLIHEYKVNMERIERIAATGGGREDLGSALFNIPVMLVDEIEATGLGGIFLSGLDEALVVSIGTGTAMVSVRDGGRRVKHVGGTGVGGGTLMGIGRCTLGKYRLETLERLALMGDVRRVNLTIQDITGKGVGILPPDATASNFGKFGDDTRPEDTAIGIFTLVGEVIGTVAYFAARSEGLEDRIVIVGGLSKSKVLAPIVVSTIELFSGKAIVPEDSEYCAAIGAAVRIAGD